MPGKGTVFTLRLVEDNTYPDALHNDSESESDANAVPEGELPLADSRALVLVVEDNADIRGVYSRRAWKDIQGYRGGKRQGGL